MPSSSREISPYGLPIIVAKCITSSVAQLALHKCNFNVAEAAVCILPDLTLGDAVCMTRNSEHMVQVTKILAYFRWWRCWLEVRMPYQSVITFLVDFRLMHETNTATESDQYFEHDTLEYQNMHWIGHLVHRIQQEASSGYYFHLHWWYNLHGFNLLSALTSEADADRSPMSAEGALAASSLHKIIVKSQPKAAADSAFEDGDDAEYFHVSVSKRDEQLALYALIAREAADTTILKFQSNDNIHDHGQNTKVLVVLPEHLLPLQQPQGRDLLVVCKLQDVWIPIMPCIEVWDGNVQWDPGELLSTMKGEQEQKHTERSWRMQNIGARGYILVIGLDDLPAPWDPGIVSIYVLAIPVWVRAKRPQRQRRSYTLLRHEHTIAWGQAMFCRGGSVTPDIPLWPQFFLSFFSRIFPFIFYGH